MQWLRQRLAALTAALDAATAKIAPPPPLTRIQRLGKAYTELQTYPRRLEDTEEGRAMLEAEPDDQRAIFHEAVAFLQGEGARIPGSIYSGAHEMACALLARPLPWTEHDIVVMLGWAVTSGRYWLVHKPTSKAVHRYLETHPLTPDIRAGIQALVAKMQGEYTDDSMRRTIYGLQRLLGDASSANPLRAGDVWADTARADILALDRATQETWHQLLQRCAEPGSTPTKKWHKAVAPLVATLGAATVRAALLRWFPRADVPRTETQPPEYVWATNHLLSMYSINTDILRGLVWLCGGEDDAEMARTLRALAVSGQRKIPGVGVRLPRVTNACIWALGEMPGEHGLAQLSVLKRALRSGAAQKLITTAMTNAATRAGLNADEVEELLVPTYGLDGVGTRTETLGTVTVTVRVVGTTDVTLTWTRENGKQVASVPRVVKTDHAEELRDLQAAVKDLQKMLPVQRDRIESLYLARTQWPFAIWRERYLEHPLVGTLARRLVWRFGAGDTTVAGIWHGDQIVGLDGVPLSSLDETTVGLWHPLHETTDSVLAWRAWLASHEVQQPFKQAHREVYVVTDAERRTSTYSNRFAAHILRQHQFNALAATKGWKNSLRLAVDDEYKPPFRVLTAWDIRAEFWVEGVGNETTGSGTYSYVTTDQVRFYPINAPQHSAHASGGGYHLYLERGHAVVEPILQEEVPALVFSEIMRDVDLFVGVASIGNDATWIDGGIERPHRQYWTSYAFGELAETAKMRREVLAGIVPRLKIAGRCELGERFLTVRGDLRTYKIHLGSGNILMEPNDQYLCIVPGQGAAQSSPANLFLPFEGDRTLAIILSKALLLAEDTKITDPTIVRQIKRT